MTVTSATFDNANNGSVKAVIDGTAFCVPVDPANRHYQDILAWVKQGNTIAAYAPPPPTADQLRGQSFTADTSRQAIINHLKSDDPASLESYIRGLINADGVTNLATAITFAKRIETAIVYIVKAIALDIRS